MIILHALYNPQDPPSLILFGETCIPSDSAGTPVHHQDEPQKHPFATDATILTELAVQFIKDPIRAESRLLLELPTTCGILSGSPQRSTALNLTSNPPDAVRFFEVPGIISQIDLLLLLPKDSDNRNQEFIPGGTLTFWTRVAELAAEMVARGRYLPTTGPYRMGGTCTLWRPVPSSGDRRRIQQLARAMPQLQARFLQYGTGPKGETRREPAIMLLLQTMIARIIRRAMRVHPGVEIFSLSSIEQLRYTEEICGLYYLRGYDRKEIPVREPNLTIGWKNKFNAWANLSEAQIADDTSWNLCLHIIEQERTPDDEEQEERPWVIPFSIRPADDPEFPIPVSLIIEGNTIPAITLPGSAELQATINSAAETIRVCSPDLKRTTLPGGELVFEIPEQDLIRFLTDDVPKIRASGIEVITPPWWGVQAEPAELRLSVREMPGTETSPVVGLQTLLNFDYRVAVGNDLVDPDEFRRMVEQKTSTIKIGKRWVTLDTDQLNQIVSRAEKRYKNQSLTIADFLRLYARSENPNEVIRVQAGDDWTENLVSFIRDGWHPEPAPVPASFCGTLRPYQQIGLSFLVTCRSIGFGACLADDMGLGKTPQTIAYLLAGKDLGTISGPSLLICPTSIIGNWERELSRFSPGLTFYVHHGAGRLKDDWFLDAIQTCDLVITSYPLIHRDIELLERIFWSVIILDEVQNIKNPQTKQFQAVRILPSRHRIALTGTPVENHLSELWAIMEVLNPGYLGSLTLFQKTYGNAIERGGADEKAEELRRMIRPFLLRRVKTDTAVISDLPEKMEMKVYCTLTHEQAALYQATLNNLALDLKSVSGIARRGKVLGALTRLKLICDHPSLVTKSHTCETGRSGKVTRLIEMLEEVVEEGDAAVIFSQYATFAQVLAEQIRSELGREVLLLIGATPRLKREEMIARFMTPNGPPIFVISLRAGGTGLNLMRATHVFHIDRWWNPAVEDQATDRTYRIGQTRAVQVHLMIAAGTLEEQIDEMIQRKRTVADQVITAGESWLTELPTGELMDVLRLREQVFGDEP